MSAPEPDPIPGPEDRGDRAWLDENHFLEPLEDAAGDDFDPADPLVVDATGKMWRLRQRTDWTPLLLGASALLVALLVLGALLAVR